MNEEKIKFNIAKNITYYRKRCNLTQLELAEKINYSDKAISKWERAEGMPDLMVTLKLCDIFNISLNDIISDKVKKSPLVSTRNRIIITILAILLVWLVAVITYVITDLVIDNPYIYLTFIYALPVSSIILIVFTAIWGKKWMVGLSVSLLIWTICLGIFLPLHFFNTGQNNALVFIIGIPFQILTIFFFLLKNRKKNL